MLCYYCNIYSEVRHKKARNLCRINVTYPAVTSLKVRRKVNTRKPVYSIWSYTRMYAGRTMYEATYVMYVIFLNMKNEEIHTYIHTPK